MRKKVNIVFQWAKTNSILLLNAASLVGTTAVTSALGFAYWWLAARQFSAEAVGLASAAISTMTLLGTFGVLGLGTLLIGELPNHRGKEAPLISAGVLLVGGAGACLGIVFAALASYLSPDFQLLGTNIGNIALFALGVSLTAMTLVLDQALIGLLRGDLQLWRNTLFAAIKLAALFIADLGLSRLTGITIYATWTIGNLVSLVALALYVIVKGRGLKKGYLPQWNLLHRLGPAALKHHALNLALVAPSLLLPLLVTISLSATVNAWFYVSWSLSSIGNSFSTALVTTLYAVSAAQPSVLARKMRLTLSLALVTTVLIDCVLLLGTRQVLELFGHNYSLEASWSLRILALESFPFIIKNHYVTLSRLRDQIARTILITIVTGLLELGGAALGARLDGLTGLSLGWFIALCLEAVCMSPTVFAAIRYTQKTPHVSGERVSVASLRKQFDVSPAYLSPALSFPTHKSDEQSLSIIESMPINRTKGTS
jgi:O-antigen/teichoic acid export membrane protein